MSEPQHPGRRDVAVAALLDDHDRVLLVRTRRLPEFWQPVGGGVEGTESFLDAAARELREEVGLELAPDALRFEISASYDFGLGEVQFFTVRLPWPRIHDLAPNCEEIEEMRWSSLAAALELPVYPATRRFLRYLSDQLKERSFSPGHANGHSNGSAARSGNRAQDSYQSHTLNDG